MTLRYFKTALLISIIGCTASAYGQKPLEEGNILVALRLIGHQVLLHSGDSTSRVLPVEKEGERYKLQFTADFHFMPDHLVSLVDNVVEKAQIANSYLVEIENCLTGQVVYSYKIGKSQKQDLVPCAGRVQPEGCYILFFTILNDDLPGLVNADLPSGSSGPKTEKAITYPVVVITILIALLVISLLVHVMKRRRIKGPGLIDLGEYQFDPLNLELRHKDVVVELSSKESDLLLLLHRSANSTLEREHILKAVWGDDGAYIGRTLDVFISKLRKKLEADPCLKIINVRGVGYKLILNGSLANTFG